MIQLLELATVSLVTERRTSTPWGLAGGEAGATGENWLWPKGDELRRTPLLDKVTVEVHRNAIQILTPGGGGYEAST